MNSNEMGKNRKWKRIINKIEIILNRLPKMNKYTMTIIIAECCCPAAHGESFSYLIW